MPEVPRSRRMVAGIDYTPVDVDRERKRGERSDEELRCVENARHLRRILSAVARIAQSDGARLRSMAALGSISALAGDIASVDLGVAALCAEEAAAEFEADHPPSTTNPEGKPCAASTPTPPPPTTP